MERVNEVTVTGIYKTEQISPTFTKQILEINSKDRDGQWRPAQLDIYIKDDLKASSAIQEGMEAKLKGWIAFNFATGGRSFPKVVVTDIIEVAQPQYQNQAVQPQALGIPPVPGAAPGAPTIGAPIQPLPNGIPVQPQMAQPTAPVQPPQMVQPTAPVQPQGVPTMPQAPQPI